MGENSNRYFGATWETVVLEFLHGNSARTAGAGASGPFDRLLSASNLDGVVSDSDAIVW
jgi:hypothetical protein